MTKTKDYNLYEYQNTYQIDEDDYLEKLDIFLNDIWKRRDKSDSQYTNSDEPDTSSQQFLSLLHKNKIKQKNYVGVIHFEGKTFNLLPKIFESEELNNLYKNLEKAENEKNEVSKNDLETKIGNEHKKINLNILWWLSYTNKIKFPKNLTSIDKFDNNSFLEVMIWLFATYTKETLTNNLYQNYMDIESETSYVKGQFMFNEYINGYLARAKWDKVYCRYDSFELDNDFNRIIKHVSNLLLNFTQNNETKRHLQDIVFILTEVEDGRYTTNDCDKVNLNHFQSEFNPILEYCKLFLANSISMNYRNKLELFAFLIPMERLFEEFIFGFIEKELKEETKLQIEKQKTGINLTVQNGYQLRPDLKITYNNKTYLADTKYKIIHESDKKLSQNDLYQMVSYAIRYECEDILLFYPQYNEDFDNKKLDKLEIVDEFTSIYMNKIKIKIHPHILPIKVDDIDLNNGTTLDEKFEKLKEDLKCKIEEAIGNKKNQ
jgi:5-methylcytosine-specific restriction enzyme subunit McrC